jgi:hypothetical protein
MSEGPGIHVEFIDEETGETFAQSTIPADDLPATFEADTTVTIGQQSWSVQRADPPTALEFRRTGRLQVWLRRVRVEMADPMDLLFSLPTIVDALPPVVPGSTKLGKRVFEIHEDDWRQVELVALRWQEAIDATFAAIRRIYGEERDGYGFRNLHVRTEIPAPLNGCAIRLTDLQARLDSSTEAYEGVAYVGAAGLVEGGFATPLSPGILLYGQEQEGQVTTVGLAKQAAAAPGEASVHQLTELASENGLCLVDWCRTLQLLPDTAYFLEYFYEQ